MKVTKVKDSPGLVRDISNKAILNTNQSALTSYKLKRAREATINEKFDDINRLKSDVAEIKLLLLQLLQNRKL